MRGQASARYKAVLRVVPNTDGMAVRLGRVNEILTVNTKEGRTVGVTAFGVVTALSLAVEKDTVFTEVHLDDGLNSAVVFVHRNALEQLNLGDVVTVLITTLLANPSEASYLGKSVQLLGKMEPGDFPVENNISENA